MVCFSFGANSPDLAPLDCEGELDRKTFGTGLGPRAERTFICTLNLRLSTLLWSINVYISA